MEDIPNSLEKRNDSSDELEAIQTDAKPMPPKRKRGFLQAAFGIENTPAPRSADEEMPPIYGHSEHEEPGFKSAFLYVERGPGSGQLIPVRQGPMVIGRASVSDLRLAHASVSRRHAQLIRKGERYYVKDLGSQNGSYVNGSRIGAEVEVHLGDELTIGHALLKLRGPSAQAEGFESVGGPVAQDNEDQLAYASKSHDVDSPSQPNVSPRPNIMRTALLGLVGGFALAGALGLGWVLTGGSSSASADGEEAEEAKTNPLVEKVFVTWLTPPAPPEAAKSDDEKEASADSEDGDEADAKEASTDDAKGSDEETAEAKTDDDKAAVAKKAKASDDEDGEETAVVSKKKKSGRTYSRKSHKGGAEMDPDVLALYEEGDVSKAISLAKKSGDTAAATKLRRFQSSYMKARAAMEENDGVGAIHGFTDALKYDRQISTGWSEYGDRVKKQLARLYSLVGAQHLKSNNKSNAKKAYALALKYDPKNSAAKEGMSRAGSSAGSKGRSSKNARANAIDAAWND